MTDIEKEDELQLRLDRIRAMAFGITEMSDSGTDHSEDIRVLAFAIADEVFALQPRPLD